MKLDFEKCSKCGGDGLKAVPVENLFQMSMPHNSSIIPLYFVVLEECECKKHDKLRNDQQNNLGSKTP